jgi:hypothetical protein
VRYRRVVAIDSPDLLAFHRTLAPLGARFSGCGCISWRDKVARFFGLDGDRTRPAIKPWPADNIDPIEELARIINEAQGRDAQDERGFNELGSERPNPQLRPRRARRS